MLDERVPDDTLLFRRVPRDQIVRDPKTGGGVRPSSKAFQNNTKPVKTNRMSIWLGDKLAQDGRAPESVVEGTTHLLVSLIAGFVYTLGQDVERTPAEAEPAHGDVVGTKSGGVKNKLAQTAEWVVPPS